MITDVLGTVLSAILGLSYLIYTQPFEIVTIISILKSSEQK